MADVVIEHTPNNVLCYIVIKDKQDHEVYREVLFTAIPDERAYGHLLGKLKWKDVATTVLLDKNGVIVKEIHIDKTNTSQLV